MCERRTVMAFLFTTDVAELHPKVIYGRFALIHERLWQETGEGAVVCVRI